MGQIKSEHPELFALEFGKIALEKDFVYTLASTKYSSISTTLKRYVTIRCWTSSIMDLIKPEMSE